MKSTATNLKILFEDNHIIVVNKRAGDLVQGDKTGDLPLNDLLKRVPKNQIQQTRERVFGGSASFGPTHNRDCYFCKNL